MVAGYFKAANPSKDQARTLLVLFLMCCFVTVAWQFPLTYLFLYPFMLISTVFHEFGHAFMVQRFLLSCPILLHLATIVHSDRRNRHGHPD